MAWCSQRRRARRDRSAPASAARSCAARSARSWADQRAAASRDHETTKLHEEARTRTYFFVFLRGLRVFVVPAGLLARELFQALLRGVVVRVRSRHLLQQRARLVDALLADAGHRQQKLR